MSYEKDDPAFPCKIPNVNTDTAEARDFYFFGGMTLRDYFAAEATEDDIRAHETSASGGFRISREEAKYAYAAAMIQARRAA